MPDKPKRKATQDVKYSNALALDLIDKCLEFNPERRITVEEALSHPYLKSLHDPQDEPAFDKQVDFSFEKSNASLNELKRIIIEDSNVVNKATGEETYDVEKIMSKSK